MSVTVPVQNGEIVNGYDPNKEAEEAKKEKSGGALGKEAFLQLLVAQMKYQDPLEPTSNTEYISQLATFSSLEEMQNMRASLETAQATSLVGKTVIMAVDVSGTTNYISGRVDQVRKEGSKTYLSIDESWYNLDDLDTVVDDVYLEATLIGDDFKEAIDDMPDPSKLNLSDKDKLSAIAKAYDSLTTYQKQHIEKYCKDALDKFKQLINRMNELIGDDFKEAIDDMPDPSKLNLSDKDKLSAIAKAYDSLTTYQKQHIEKYCKDALDKFKQLINRMNELLGNSSDDSTDKVEGEGDSEEDKDSSTEGTGGATEDKEDTSGK